MLLNENKEKSNHGLPNDLIAKTISMQIRPEIRMVTPEMAKNWLTVNTMNRRPDRRTVDFYADQMENGLWTLSQDALAFGTTHILLNGQHRLMAVVKSNTTQPFFVIFNLDESIFKNIDQHKKRSPADIFQTAGVLNYVPVSAGINKYITLKKGHAVKGCSYTAAPRVQTKTSMTDMLSFYYENKSLIDEVVLLSGKYYSRFKYFKNSDYFAYMLLLVIDKKHNLSKVKDFFFQLSHGGTDIKNNSISLLRDKIIFNETSMNKMSAVLRHALIVKTWNAFIKNHQYKVLSIRPNSDKEELL